MTNDHKTKDLTDLDLTGFENLSGLDSLDSNYKTNLPAGWIWTTIEAICTPPQYGYTTKAATDGDIKLLRTTDITSGQIDWEKVPFCFVNPDDPEKYLLQQDDIVISRAGSVGVSYLIENPKYSVFASYLIRFKPLIYKKFFKYFLDSPFYWKSISEKKLGIAIPNVNASKLKTIEFPLPPLAEQHRIVAKIEELFSDLDHSVAALEQARKQLKIYRQAVLKYAFEGKLTEKWRAANPDLTGFENLSGLIRAERESRTQQQLEAWQAAVKEWESQGKPGRKPAKPRQPKTLLPLTEAELAELPSLPERWGWVRLGVLIEEPKYGTSKKCSYKIDGIPVLRIPNVRNSVIDESDLKFAQFSEGEKNIYSLKDGDLWITLSRKFVLQKWQLRG